MNRTPHLPDVRWGSQKHQNWRVFEMYKSFHYQGDYQELLGCLLCAGFQDLAMRHLVPALGRYDCALVSSTELLHLLL